MPNITSLFSVFYYDRIRQESDCTWHLRMLHLKRFNMGSTVYECTEEEFYKLLHLCREIAKQNPKALTLDDGISYHDSLDKKIGTHALMYEFSMNHEQIKEFVAKYYPSE